MRAINRLAEFDFIIENERGLPEDQQTVWKLQGLPYELQVSLQSKIDPVMRLPGGAIGKGKDTWNKAMADSQVEMHLGTGGQKEIEFEILKHGLLSVSNFIDMDGNEVEYPRTANDKNKKNWFAQYLPREIRTEIANAITERSSLSEDEQKN